MGTATEPLCRVHLAWASAPLADMIVLVGWDQTYDDNHMVYINALRESKGLPPMVPKHFVGPYAASRCKQDEAAFLEYCSMVNDPFSEAELRVAG